MQRLTGVLMVLAGTTLSGYMVLPAHGPQTLASRLIEAARLSVPAGRSRPSLAAPALTTPAEAASAASAPQPAVEPPAADASGKRVFSAAAPLTPPASVQAAAPVTTSTWTAVVTAEPNAAGKLKSSKPGDAETRAQLAGDLQRELKRVGCYAGEITNTWTPSTKRAMSVFMERVNATLPVDQPDYILLTLVQGHTAVACGASCPSGQVMSGAGRCVPQAVVAQASRKTQREEDRRVAEERKAQQQEMLAQEQRSSEAKRLADARKVSADAARVAAAVAADKAVEKAATAARVASAAVASQKSAQVEPQQTASAEPEKLPWLNGGTPAVTVAGNGGAAPPPGMMSIGGPHQAVANVPESAAAVTPDSGPRPPAGEAVDPSQTSAATTAAVPVETETLTPPAPQRAVRPTSRQAAFVHQGPVAGLPGTKAGPAVRRSVTRTYPPGKVVRHAPPANVYSAPKPKTYSFASNSSGKMRRGQPHMGTAHYNLMLSLGGIY